MCVRARGGGSDRLARWRRIVPDGPEARQSQRRRSFLRLPGRMGFYVGTPILRIVLPFMHPGHDFGILRNHTGEVVKRGPGRVFHASGIPDGFGSFGKEADLVEWLNPGWVAQSAEEVTECDRGLRERASQGLRVFFARRSLRNKLVKSIEDARMALLERWVRRALLRYSSIVISTMRSTSLVGLGAGAPGSVISSPSVAPPRKTIRPLSSANRSATSRIACALSDNIANPHQA